MTEVLYIYFCGGRKPPPDEILIKSKTDSPFVNFIPLILNF